MERGSGSQGGSGGGDAVHGMRFGKKVYFEDTGGRSGRAAAAGSESGGSSAGAARRGKGVAQGRQPPPPRCQVEGCKADLTVAKAYYCRHKVCGVHSKSPKVIVAGLEQRFCQQCSRFHQLPEFDQGKRSCRRRLAGHNERRRKPPPGSLPSRYGRLPSTFNEDSNRFGGLLLDFSHPRVSSNVRDEWPMVRVGDRGAPSHWQAGLSTQSSGVVANMAHPYMQGSAGRTLFPNQEVPPGERFGVSDSSCALSLLSTQPWGTTPPTRSRPPTISENYEGGSLARAAVSFTCNSWTFKGQSSSAHECLREVGSGQAAEPVDGQFSGELELALQGSRQFIDPGNGRVYGPGSLAHWSL